MNGRSAFLKYGKLIHFLVTVAKKMPRRVRRFILNVNRRKTSKVGFLMRYVAVASLAKHIGNNVAIFPDVYFEYIENLSIGDNVSIHQMCYIDAEGGIEIGNDVSIAHRSTILSGNHGYTDSSIPIKYQDMILAKTVIQDNVWIGCGCVVLAGVVIGTGSVIGANSVVTKSITKNSVAVGSPAKRIKARIKTEE